MDLSLPLKKNIILFKEAAYLKCKTFLMSCHVQFSNISITLRKFKAFNMAPEILIWLPARFYFTSSSTLCSSHTSILDYNGPWEVCFLFRFFAFIFLLGKIQFPQTLMCLILSHLSGLYPSDPWAESCVLKATCTIPVSMHPTSSLLLAPCLTFLYSRYSYLTLCIFVYVFISLLVLFCQDSREIVYYYTTVPRV